jgi:multidrug efflux pump subunit AcrA (membrane-fusion protein)
MIPPEDTPRRDHTPPHGDREAGHEPPSSGSTSYLSETAKIVLPLVILAAGVAAFFILIKLKEAPAKQERKREIPIVETTAVESSETGLNIEVDGEVVPYREINIAAEVSGRIVMKSEKCRAGNYVTKDMELIEIDPTIYRLEVERLTEQLEQAESNLKQHEIEVKNTRELKELAEEELELQKNEFERLKDLRANRVVSEDEYDQIKRQLVKARTAVAQLNNQLSVLAEKKNALISARDSAKVALQRAEVDLSHTKITSPVDGVVAEHNVEEDSYVNVGTPLLTIEDTTRVEIKCHLRTDQIYWLWLQNSDDKKIPASASRDYQIPNVPVTVIYEISGRKFAWEGFLSRYEGVGLDPKTRTIPCRIEVPSPRKVRVIAAPRLEGDKTVNLQQQTKYGGPPALLRGMFVTIVLHAKPDANLMAVPEIAVQPGNQVYEVIDNKILIQDVQVVKVDDDQAILRSTDGKIVPGDQVVISPISGVTSGMQVNWVSNSSDSPSDTKENAPPPKARTIVKQNEESSTDTE